MPAGDWMDIAVQQAARAPSLDGHPSPLVGAAVVKGNRLLASGFRSEEAAGDHAEYTVMERKLKDQDLSGAWLYTTLEPCISRKHPKVPCAQRIIERGIVRVVIGMLDPNPEICGRGLQQLRAAGIEAELAPHEIMLKLEAMNGPFVKLHRPRPSDVESLALRDIDGWYVAINRIYAERNRHLPLSDVFAHLVEIVGGLSGLASDKTKPGVDPARHVQKAIAWWLSLCGHAGIKSVSSLLVRKFPRICPYCQCAPHEEDSCRAAKAEHGGPAWKELTAAAERVQPPAGLADWLEMFRRVYPVSQTEQYGPSFARLTEELGELAEAVRLFNYNPSYFVSEAADVFAWLMRIENIRESKNRTKEARGHELARGFATSYPDYCTDCQLVPCRCPPVLRRTVGRIAKDVPSVVATGLFMTQDEQLAKFFAT